MEVIKIVFDLVREQRQRVNIIKLVIKPKQFDFHLKKKNKESWKKPKQFDTHLQKVIKLRALEKKYKKDN